MVVLLDPIEVFGSTPVGAYKVKVYIDNVTDLGSFTGSLEGFHDGVSNGSFLGEYLEVQTSSM